MLFMIIIFSHWVPGATLYPFFVTKWCGWPNDGVRRHRTQSNALSVSYVVSSPMSYPAPTSYVALMSYPYRMSYPSLMSYQIPMSYPIAMSYPAPTWGLDTTESLCSLIFSIRHYKRCCLDTTLQAMLYFILISRYNKTPGSSALFIKPCLMDLITQWHALLELNINIIKIPFASGMNATYRNTIITCVDSNLIFAANMFPW